MSTDTDSELERDALAEIVNIGMGQAGDSLARLLGTFIQLSVPRVHLVAPRDAMGVVETLIGVSEPLIAVRQAFQSRARGEAITVYHAGGCDALNGLTGYRGAARDELLLEVSNLLAGACLNGVGAQISAELTFSPPSILGDEAALRRALSARDAPWSAALIAEVSFRIEGHPFRAHLLTFWPDDAIAVLRLAVAALLSGLS